MSRVRSLRALAIGVTSFAPHAPNAKRFRVAGGLGLPVPEGGSVLIDLGSTSRVRDDDLCRLTWRLIPAGLIAVTGRRTELVEIVTRHLRAASLVVAVVDEDQARGLRATAAARARKVDVMATRWPHDLLRVVGRPRGASAVVRVALPDPQDDECAQIAAQLAGVSTAYLVGHRPGCLVLARWLARRSPALAVHVTPAGRRAPQHHPRLTPGRAE